MFTISTTPSLVPRLHSLRKRRGCSLLAKRVEPGSYSLPFCCMRLRAQQQRKRTGMHNIMVGECRFA